MTETEKERSVRLALRATDAEIALEAARFDLARMGEALDSARQEVDDLRAALRPFALAERANKQSGAQRFVSAKHFARAAALLEG